jgi:TRAF3-interacting protein 1
MLKAESELKRAGAEAAAAAADGAGGDGDAGGTGIILARRNRSAQGGAAGRAGDVGALRESVQRLCAAALPLARGVESLSDDVDNMAREFRFWATERRVYQERLAEAQRAAQDLTASERRVADADAQIRASRERIASLRAAVLRNDETAARLLRSVVA